MVCRIPVTTAWQLAQLDEAEMLEGYQDGLENGRCGDNRSISYWHGWRNGMVDGKHAEIDSAQLTLASIVAKGGVMRCYPYE